MATHIKRLSDSPCSENCSEMSEEVEISFQCLCCKINNDKNLENLVDFDTVEELCAHLAVTHLQNFIISDLKNSDTKNDKTRQKTCKFMNEKYLSLNMVTLEEQELHMKSHKQRFFTTSKMDRHLLRQKVCQKISVIKTNTFDDIKK